MTPSKERLEMEYMRGWNAGYVEGKTAHLKEMSAKGGSANTEAQTMARQENGKKGGRPRSKHESI